MPCRFFTHTEENFEFDSLDKTREIIIENINVNRFDALLGTSVCCCLCCRYFIKRQKKVYCLEMESSYDGRGENLEIKCPGICVQYFIPDKFTRTNNFINVEKSL